MDDLEIYSWLKDAQLSRNLPNGLLRFIAAHARERQLRDREFFFLQGDPGDFIGFVMEGMVYHQMFGPDGRELIVSCSAPGEIFGLSALFGQPPRRTAARVSGATRALILSRQHFIALSCNRVFLEHLMAWLHKQSEQNLDFIETVCLYPLEARLARHILQNLEKSPAPHFKLPAHQGLLAAMINASRPKLNVRLRSWVTQGLARVRGGALLIDDLPQIRLRAHLSR
ncbi:MAG: Crp/Fnr family transcriptional regulator [Zoogloeaceae bacterium]|jgi:CRP-like cAMP-binding protein|nr:Crp/Fnr family transcriptional regulator [Zoogloeaceae bacterium]